MKNCTSSPLVKSLAVILASFFVASCTNSHDQSGAAYDSASTRTTTPSNMESEPTPQSTKVSIDSSLFIAKVDVFESTSEYFVELSLLPQVVGTDANEYLRGKADSVLYQDSDIKRSVLPFEIAREYFNLTGLERISVYSNGEYVTDASLVRVEHLDDNILQSYIAVFKPINTSTFSRDVSYCVSKGPSLVKHKDVSGLVMEDSSLTNEILLKLDMDTKNVWHVVHVKTAPDNVIYSGITYPNEVFLIETTRGNPVIVKKVDKDYFISDIIPVHLEVNGKPVLILQMGINETDIIWNSLAVYSGEQYEFHMGDRLKGEIYL